MIEYTTAEFTDLACAIEKALSDTSCVDLIELADKLEANCAITYLGNGEFLIDNDDGGFADVCDLVNRKVSELCFEDITELHNSLIKQTVAIYTENSVFFLFQAEDLKQWSETDAEFHLTTSGDFFGYTYEGIIEPEHFSTDLAAIADAYYKCCTP